MRRPHANSTSNGSRCGVSVADFSTNSTRAKGSSAALTGLLIDADGRTSR
jgi:hypothetical protein